MKHARLTSFAEMLSKGNFLSGKSSKSSPDDGCRHNVRWCWCCCEFPLTADVSRLMIFIYFRDAHRHGTWGRETGKQFCFETFCVVSRLPPKKCSDWVGDISGSYFKLLNVQYCIFIALFPPFSLVSVSWREEKNVLKLLFVCLFGSVYHFFQRQPRQDSFYGEFKYDSFNIFNIGTEQFIALLSLKLTHWSW